MREYGSRVALHDVEILARESHAFLRGGNQGARLRDQLRGVIVGQRLAEIERLVDGHDEFRKLMQPSEPGVVEHQLQVLAGSGDALDIPLIEGALGIHQVFVKAQQAVAQGGEALAGCIGGHVHLPV